MAAATVSNPGEQYGPCVDEQCGHRDCDCSRKTAACVCRICNEPIGYERRYLDEWYEQPEGANRYGYFIHELCLIDEIERRRASTAT